MDRGDLESKDTFRSDMDLYGQEKVSSESELSDEQGIHYFEESTDSEPEVDCDLWDVDCKVVTYQIIKGSITGYHLMPTCSNDPDLQVYKKQKIVPEINSNLTTEAFNTKFLKSWDKKNSYKNETIDLIQSPFSLCIVNNFLENPSFLETVRQEIFELTWNARNMDLYEFFQSRDLKYISSENIKVMYNFLKEDVMKWVGNITGYHLTHMSATCSFYSNTDYLLVHDDQREDRMIAFVLYLTGPEGWIENKGGALQLLSKDEQGQPSQIVKNIFPANNQLVFFPVTSDSYHQVAEVTSIDDVRLSINGWFHTKIAPVFETLIFTPRPTGLFSSNVIHPRQIDIDLESWINDDYLEKKAIKQIQHHIEENSEISLHNFFKHECFNVISEVLSSKDLKWIKVGPPNRYSYETVDTTSLPHVLDRFLNLFQSEKMFSLLQKYTDLDLTSPTANMKFELQKWVPGNYSLLSDYNWYEKNELDLIVYFGCKNGSDVIGARTQYVTIDDEIQNALITLEPQENNLNIVYRDSARFTKYYSVQSKCKCFYSVICSYCE